MRRPDAARLGVKRVSDLTAQSPSLRMAGDYEIFQRPEWTSIERAYGLSFKERRSMDPSLLYDAARTGQVDVISAFSTDGRIVAYDLVTLEDDRHAIPPYDALVLVSARLAREHPEAVTALASLAGTIDAEKMRSLNAAVDDKKESPARVAERFLEESPSRR
jgi:osmoprotectant transport system permease protein